MYFSIIWNHLLLTTEIGDEAVKTCEYSATADIFCTCYCIYSNCTCISHTLMRDPGKFLNPKLSPSNEQSECPILTWPVVVNTWKGDTATGIHPCSLQHMSGLYFVLRNCKLNRKRSKESILVLTRELENTWMSEKCYGTILPFSLCVYIHHPCFPYSCCFVSLADHQCLDNGDCQVTQCPTIIYRVHPQTSVAKLESTYRLCGPKLFCSLKSLSGSMQHTDTSSPLAHENLLLAALSHWCMPHEPSSLNGKDTGKLADRECLTQA